MRLTDSTDRRWHGLILLCVAWFLVIMDVAIVGIGALSIKEDLGFSQGSLQWVATAYAITFGGLLLFAGRVADVLGRRRMFVAGALLFALASLAAGLAPRANTGKGGLTAPLHRSAGSKRQPSPATDRPRKPAYIRALPFGPSWLVSAHS